ncbi:hypothetical protein [Jeotgalibacillus proteolyticus]|uniref:YhfM-like domain-containing protein n=1 Tax=Jeotgalibacillus proteolyticus TaxID=2082395 RepID=A0A2S5GD03_9BACL|nr:hypothetical protein [Jeotgalibacillus proteolyticus]PPA70917.1 hypothetical protein C4B60_09015 [Jeotgalibacillus proteolyticus]
MKKTVFAALALFFALAGIILASSTFSKIDHATIQYWSPDTGGYGDESYITDKSSLKEIREIMNKARHEKRQSEKAQSANIRMTLVYEDNREEKIYLWKESGQFTIFTSGERDGTYYLSDGDATKGLENLLK